MKKIEPTCGNCLLYRRDKGDCGVAVLIEGKTFHMPVEPKDHCHMEELGVEIQQVRWWVENKETGEKTDKEGLVKVEYPEGFFGR